MSLSYSFVENQDKQAVTVFLDGELHVAENNHPNWAAIKEGILRAAGGGSVEGLAELFDTEKAVSSKFEKYSDRVSVKDGQVYLDNEVQHGTLVTHIVRALNEGLDNFEPLVKFMENVAANPSERSREQLYTWLDACNRSSSEGFTIDEDGYIHGYKGVMVVDEDENLFSSISSGNAIVNGVEHSGRIPQTFGDVVEMPRSSVADDPNVHCHTGLHVGVWEYASSFAQGAVLEVKFNPRDVVSVPNDYSAQKLRTCRYTVVAIIDAPFNKAVQVDYDHYYDDEELDYEDEEDFGEYEYDDLVGDVDSTGSETGRHLNFSDVRAFPGMNGYSTTNNHSAGTTTYVHNVTKSQRVTDNNYQSLKRDANGRFLPKS